MYRISTVVIESDSCLENMAMRLIFLESLLYFFSQLFSTENGFHILFAFPKNLSNVNSFKCRVLHDTILSLLDLVPSGTLVSKTLNTHCLQLTFVFILWPLLWSNSHKLHIHSLDSLWSLFPRICSSVPKTSHCSIIIILNKVLAS